MVYMVMVYMVLIPSRIYYEVATTYQVPGTSPTYTITITTYHIPPEVSTAQMSTIQLAAKSFFKS